MYRGRASGRLDLNDPPTAVGGIFDFLRRATERVRLLDVFSDSKELLSNCTPLRRVV